VKLFRKPNSKFYWYDFTVRGRRYRASTEETKSVRALKIASLKLASVIENTDPRIACDAALLYATWNFSFIHVCANIPHRFRLPCVRAYGATK
jgi:hypothetical protein